MPMTNDEVILAWMTGLPGVNHRQSLSTTGKQLYSYALQIGDTLEDGRKVVADYTSMGSHGFKSQTTSCHVGIARIKADVVV
jgi:hypothetical protein